MANKKIFSPGVASSAVTNHAGGLAFAKSDEQALAQFVMTGTFNDTFYVKGEDQLAQVLERSQKMGDEFLAKLAIYSREHGFMKDMPALLCALLVVRGSEHADAVFARVIDNAKMLRNFVQMLRGGVVGRKSLGSKAKRLVKGFIANLSDYALWEASVGNDPSLTDVLKLAHPKAKDDRRNALYAYVMGKPCDAALLPDFIRDYESFAKGEVRKAPLKVPFQKLTALPLSTKDWARIATNARWQMTRMNLNTFSRHGVFEDRKMVSMVAERLANRENVLSARAFPYQLMAAMINAGSDVPLKIRTALEDAMEIALENVPEISGRTVVAIDVSGSMGDPVTGHRAGSTSSVKCINVAALVGAALRRKNRQATILTFDFNCREVKVAANARIMTICEKIGRSGGGTDCGSVMRYINDQKIALDNLVLVSDNESWRDGYRSSLSELWAGYKTRFPKARMINLDITPNEYSATAERKDTLRVGGFSDEVFRVMAQFLEGSGTQVDAVNAVQL